MDKATQQVLILRYCREHGSITIRDAFEKLHINSPSKRISELRLSGEYEVTDITEEKIYASGKKTRYKRYFIKEVDA